MARNALISAQQVRTGTIRSASPTSTLQRCLESVITTDGSPVIVAEQLDVIVDDLIVRRKSRDCDEERRHT